MGPTFGVLTSFLSCFLCITYCARNVNANMSSLFLSLHKCGGPCSAGNDGFLPAVLVLIHTIRKYAKEDRDFIALVSSAVSEV